MMFRMIAQVWNTNTLVIVSRDAQRTTCIFQCCLEQEFMYFAGKLVYLIVLASNQLDVNPSRGKDS